MSIPGFLKQDGLSLRYSKKGKMVFYIPEVYFERQYIAVDSDRLSLIGLFNYARFDETGKPVGGLQLFKFPSIFTCIPSEIEKVKGIKLTKDHAVDDYRLLKFTENDIVILSSKVPKSVDNVELFLKMVHTGKIPRGIPYNEFHELMIENAQINGINYPTSAQLIGIIGSEIFRSKSDITKPFRLSKFSNYNDYVTLNINELPRLSSPFAALTGENWNESLVNAMSNKDYKESPIERMVR